MDTAPNPDPDKPMLVGTLTQDGLSYRGLIIMRARKDYPHPHNTIVYTATLKVDRETGPIEGYYELSIFGIHRHFDSFKESEDFLNSTLEKIKDGKSKLLYENDKYYVHDCCYHLFVEGVNDAEEKELREWLEERDSDD